jgi:membrane-associated phospholipid phosphatase
MGRSRTLRAWLAGGVVTGVLVIAATRLYLGVHWLTDVTAGAILAAVFVTIGATVFAALHDRSGQHDAPPVAASTGEDPPGDDVRRRAREPRHPDRSGPPRRALGALARHL